MMMNEHTAKAFDVDLQELTRLVAERGDIRSQTVRGGLRGLAETFRDDRDSYAEGKTAFITAVLLDARDGRRRERRR